MANFTSCNIICLQSNLLLRIVCLNNPGHLSCCDLQDCDPDKLEPWSCLDCKACEQCGSSRGNYLLCDECDRAWHGACLDPPLVTPPPDGGLQRFCSAAEIHVVLARLTYRFAAYFLPTKLTFAVPNAAGTGPVRHRRPQAHRNIDIASREALQTQGPMLQNCQETLSTIHKFHLHRGLTH